MCEWVLACARLPLALVHEFLQMLFSVGCVFFANRTCHAVPLVVLLARHLPVAVCPMPKESVTRSSARVSFGASCAATIVFAFQTYNFSLEDVVVVYLPRGEVCQGQHGSACGARYPLARFAHVHALTFAAPEGHQGLRYATLTASLGIGLCVATGLADYRSVVRKKVGNILRGEAVLGQHGSA